MWSPQVKLGQTSNKVLISSFPYKQNLVTKLVVTLGYNFTKYLFIGGEF